MSTGRRTAITAGGLVVVLLLAGCTGDARPPVDTRSADATPVPAPEPEHTRVPMWTPGPTVASEQTVRALELSWPDGTPVEIEVVAPAAVVRAVEGEDFLPFASPAPSTTWPLAVLGDGSMVVRGEQIATEDGERWRDTMGLVGPQVEEPYRPFDMAGVVPGSQSTSTLAGTVAVDGQRSVWTMEFEADDGAIGWQVLTADEDGAVSVVASSAEDWSAVHEHALGGPSYINGGPAPIALGGRVYLSIPLDDAAMSSGNGWMLVSRGLVGGDTRVEEVGVWDPVATSDAVYVRGESADGAGDGMTEIRRVDGDPVLLLPAASPMVLDGAAGEWLVLSSPEAVLAVHPTDRRVVGVGRSTPTDPESPGAGPASGGSDLVVWSDDPYAEHGSTHFVLDPDAAVVWELPSLLDDVVVNSHGILGWMESGGPGRSVRYVRWRS